MPPIGPSHEKYIEWQCPPLRPAARTSSRGSMSSFRGEAISGPATKEGTKNVERDIRLLLGLDQDNSMKTNMLMPNIRTFVETISNLRQIATLGHKRRAIQNLRPDLQQGTEARLLGELEYVFNLRRTLQWTMLGSGMVWTHFTKPYYGNCFGRARNIFDALGPFEGLPEQLPLQQRHPGCLRLHRNNSDAHLGSPRPLPGVRGAPDPSEPLRLEAVWLGRRSAPRPLGQEPFLWAMGMGEPLLRNPADIHP